MSSDIVRRLRPEQLAQGVSVLLHGIEHLAKPLDYCTLPSIRTDRGLAEGRRLGAVAISLLSERVEVYPLVGPIAANPFDVSA